MTTGIFTHTHRVTYASCTVGDHVYYSRYLDMLEEARGEFFRQLEFPLKALHKDGFMLPVRECRIQYHSAARYDDLLTIRLKVIRCDRLRVNFRFEIVNKDQAPVADGQTDHVCTSTEEKPRRMSAELLKKLKLFTTGDD